MRKAASLALLLIVALAAGCAAAPSWRTPPLATLRGMVGGAVVASLTDEQRLAIDAAFDEAAEIDPPSMAYSPQMRADYVLCASGSLLRLYMILEENRVVTETRKGNDIHYRYYDAPALCAVIEGLAAPGETHALAALARIDAEDLALDGTSVDWQLAAIPEPDKAGFWAYHEDERRILAAAFPGSPDARVFIDRVEVCSTHIRVSVRLLDTPEAVASGLAWCAVSCAQSDLPARPVVFVGEGLEVLAVLDP